MRRLLFRSAALLALTCSVLSGMPGIVVSASQANDSGPSGQAVSATYRGQLIDPVQASHYFCHTRDYPIVRCFDTQAEVDSELGLVEPLAPGLPDSTSSGQSGSVPQWDSDAYTIAYWDINYGGTSLTVYGAISNLATIGWNDSVSSIKSINCGIPRYYVDPSYDGAYWQNSCNVWSPNLYSANDTFSSVVDEAP